MKRTTHPGETLRELLVEREYTQRSVARHAGINFVILNEILSGKRGIGPVQAARLAKLELGTAAFWLQRQKNYNADQRLSRARAAAARASKKAKGHR